MINTPGRKPLPADSASAQGVRAENLTPFKTNFLLSPAPQRVSKPYTRLDAFTTGLSVITGWLVVLALVYLGISRYTGGASIISLLLYISLLAVGGFLFKDAIASYFKHTIRTDLLPKKR